VSNAVSALLSAAFGRIAATAPDEKGWLIA
jgi:hypothetical protein